MTSADVTWMLAEIDRLRAELAAAQEREARVRRVHCRESYEDHAAPDYCDDDAQDWPCLTIAALADPAPSGETP